MKYIVALLFLLWSSSAFAQDLLGLVDVVNLDASQGKIPSSEILIARGLGDGWDANAAQTLKIKPLDTVVVDLASSQDVLTQGLSKFKFSLQNASNEDRIKFYSNYKDVLQAARQSNLIGADISDDEAGRLFVIAQGLKSAAKPMGSDDEPCMFIIWWCDITEH